MHKKALTKQQLIEKAIELGYENIDPACTVLRDPYFDDVYVLLGVWPGQDGKRDPEGEPDLVLYLGTGQSEACYVRGVDR